MQFFYNLYVLRCIFLAVMTPFFTLVSQADDRTRLIVLTDIANEPDDEQSLIRLLVYADHFQIEGIIATTSVWLKDTIHPEKICERIDAYEKIYPNLLKHSKDYPTAEYLRSVTKNGNIAFGMKGVGKGKTSEASEHIIAVVDREDPRPVWIIVWGGALDLAQSLWDVKSTRGPEARKRFIDKIRIYDIAGQDDAGAWICHNFPDIFYIRNISSFIGMSQQYASPNPVELTGPALENIDHEWVKNNVWNHGALGAFYTKATYKYEGDTPSLLYLIRNGLSDPMQPSWGSWGGRFTSSKVVNPQMYWKYNEWAENYRPYSMYIDTIDTWKYRGEIFKSSQASLFRWREAFQNDFAARMDRCLPLCHHKVNHNPSAAFNGIPSTRPHFISLRKGSRVIISAEGSSDPDLDSLSYKWYLYPEAGSYPAGNVVLTESGDKKTELILSEKGSGTLHIILEVKDSGTPPLFSYQRIIVNIY